MNEPKTPVKIEKRTTEVYCTFQIEGTHMWTACPYPEVYYLSYPHRHMFHIKAHASVDHADRDLEFIMLKHLFNDYLIGKYYNPTQRLCTFGSMSCEMIAGVLLDRFDFLTRVEVSEDGENGGIVTREWV